MGMQVLIEHSEENGGTDCLGRFAGQVRYFGEDYRDENGRRIKIPHMGWNRVSQTRTHPLWRDIDDGSRFYFVHSYYFDADDDELEVGSTEYGIGFTSAIARDNLFALQCHPEKSARNGLRLLKNFVNWNGRT
jgi:glutamine amidotransferase